MPKAPDELESSVQVAWRFRTDPPGGMATRWFMVVEGMDADGDRWMDYFWPDDLKTWDVKGMLHDALDSQAAGQVATEVWNEAEE